MSNDSFGRAVTRTPNSDTITLSGRLSGLGATTWVVIYHLTSGAFAVIDEGYLGVDVFFILSGHVLCYVYAAKFNFDLASYFRFLSVRLARICPLHFVTLVVLAAFVLAFPQFAVRHTFADRRLVRGLASVGAKLEPLLPTCWNTPARSLSAEWFAYLAFPGFLLLTQWPRSARGPLVIVCVLFASYNALLLVRGDPLDAHGTTGMLRMATEFAAGCLLFRAYRNGLGRLSGAYEAAVVGCLAVTYLNPRLNGFALLGFALVVLLAAQKTGVVAGLLSLRHVVYLGEISYSIYLVHWPLIQVSNWVYFDRALHIVGSRFVVWATIPAAILAVSAASYRWIELPARAWGRRLAGSVPAGAVLATKA